MFKKASMRIQVLAKTFLEVLKIYGCPLYLLDKELSIFVK